MNIGNRLRVVALTILISIIMISFCPFGQLVCYAADDDLTVSMSVPKWSYDEFSYSKVTVSGTTDTKKVKTISIHTENGYIVGSSLPDLSSVGKWSTELSETHNSKTTYQTVVGSLGSDGYTKEQTEELIKSIVFMLESYDKEITVTIDLDAADAALPAGTNVTRGTGILSNHYYMYVPAERITWSEAYNAAKSMKFMGMQGYLVTITCKEEDEILDNITMAGAWSGGFFVKKNATITNSTNDEWFDTNVPFDNLDNYVWKWVNGPEKGKMIKISNSAASKKKAIDPATAKDGDGNNLYKAVTYDAAGNPILDSGDYINYSNWNRNLYYYTSAEDKVGIRVDFYDIDPDTVGKRPLDGDEPNDSFGEYCMQVHYESTGSHTPESKSENRLAKGWNDLPDNSTIITVSGYFVEFDGVNYSSQSHAKAEEEEPYEHTWKYTPQSSEAGKPNDEIVINCNDEHHINCIHKINDPKKIKTYIKLDASDILYSSKSYDKETIKVYEGNEEKSLSDYGIKDSDITINYVGRSGTTYTGSANPPTNVGKYTVEVTIVCGGEPVTIKKDFEISQVNLTITLNDQSVKKNDSIDKSYNEIGLDKGLIKEITGLQGEGSNADKLASIDQSAIKADTSAVGHTDGGIKIEGPYNGEGHTIVIEDGNGNDVTDNYSITVVRGDLDVDMKEPGIILPAPSALDLIYGQKLSESKITGHFKDSVSGDELAGTITWDDPDILPEVKDSRDGLTPKDFEATFKPDNNEIYSALHVTIQIGISPKDLPGNINSKTKTEITADISMDIANKAIIDLFDTQTNKDLILNEDYTVTEVTDTSTNKVKITIKGINNYKGEYTVDKDLWTGRIITQEVYDDSADEMNPSSLSKISDANGTKLFIDKIDRLNQSDEGLKKAHDIVHQIQDLSASAQGDYRALISVYISNADSTVTALEKSCATSAIGAKISGKTPVPAKAEIGLYFDVSMDIQYYVEDKTTNPSTILVQRTEEIHDTSSTAISFGGFSEKVTITVPNRLRPSKNHTRKYYIIRVHDDNAGNGSSPSYSYTVMPCKQNKYELTFETDKFSKYALAYTDTKKSGGNTDEGSDPSDEPSGGSVTAPINNEFSVVPTTVQVTAPKTGDTEDMTVSVVMILAGVILLAAVLYKNRKNCQE